MRRSNVRTLFACLFAWTACLAFSGVRADGGAIHIRSAHRTPQHRQPVVRSTRSGHRGVRVSRSPARRPSGRSIRRDGISSRHTIGLRRPSVSRTCGNSRWTSHITIGYRPKTHRTHHHYTRRHIVRRHHYRDPRVYVSKRYYGWPRTVYLPSPTVYVERTYEPREETIRYVPIERQPVSRPTDSISSRGSFLDQGNAVFRQGRYDEARRLYVRALLANGADAESQMGYGLVHFAEGCYAPAASALRRALAAEPRLLDAPLDPRSMYGVNGDFEKHRATLRDHVAEQPHDIDAVFFLAYVEYACGETESAIEHLNRVVVMDDRDTLAYLLRDAIASASVSSENG